MGIPRAENGALSDREVKGDAEHERDRKKVSRSDDDDDQSDSNTLQYALRALVRGTTFLLGARALVSLLIIKLPRGSCIDLNTNIFVLPSHIYA